MTRFNKSFLSVYYALYTTLDHRNFMKLKNQNTYFVKNNHYYIYVPNSLQMRYQLY